MTNPFSKAAYQEYLADFDPSPQYAFDGYSTPLDYDDWCDQQFDSFGLYVL